MIIDEKEQIVLTEAPDELTNANDISFGCVHYDILSQYNEQSLPPVSDSPDTERIDSDDEIAPVASDVSDREELGRGMLGVTCKAKHHLLPGTSVVMKVFHRQRLRDPSAIKALRQDVEQILDLTHPHLATAFFADLDDPDHAVLISDFVEGHTLEELLLSEGFLSADQCVDIFKQVCEGLSALHAHDVVHRNLKPSNIMITRSTTDALFVKLLDGGIARSGSRILRPANRHHIAEFGTGIVACEQNR